MNSRKCGCSVRTEPKMYLLDRVKSSNRVSHALENVLKEAKVNTIRDHRPYQQEMDHMKGADGLKTWPRGTSRRKVCPTQTPSFSNLWFVHR